MLLSRLSIVTRLIILSTVLLSVPVAMHLFLREKLGDDAKFLEEAVGIVTVLRYAHSASRDFGEIKFHLADLAASHLVRSEAKLNEARLAFVADLDQLERSNPAIVSQIRKELELFWPRAQDAIAAYVNDRRVLGNARMAAVHGHIDAIDLRLNRLVNRLESLSLRVSEGAKINSEVAVNISLSFVVMASMFWLVSTLLVLRSITIPLKELVDSINSISGGDLEIEIETRRHDEFGVMARTLVQFRDGLKERDKIQQDQQRAEADARDARASAEQANQAKTDFLANMTHELRTPLSSIIGFSELMKREAFGPLGSEEYKDYVEDMLDCGNHLMSLVNDVLNISKIEAGQFDLRSSRIMLPDMVDATVRILNQRAAKAELQLVQSSDKDMPPIWLDERTIKQILFNLLSNAIKFSKPGGFITVRSWMDTEHRACVRVTDQGIGMAPEEIEKALEPFVQLDTALNRSHAGTGLGLPLVKTMVELHGGQMSLSSELGAGTDITIQFPVERSLYPGVEPPKSIKSTDISEEAGEQVDQDILAEDMLDRR